MSSRRKILIVDDEADVIKYLDFVLTDHGFEVETCSSAVQALELLESFNPDLITLDIMMPRKSGIWFYKKLRDEQKYIELPVVIVSGIKEASEFDFRDLLPDESVPEPQAFIEKPINVGKFVSKIEELTD